MDQPGQVLMRALIVLALVSAGCALKFDVGLSIGSNRPAPVQAQPPSAIVAQPPPTTVSELVDEYRTSVDEACLSGVLTAEACVRHRARIVAIMQAENRMQQRIEAQRAVEDAESVEHPQTRSVLGTITRLIRTVLRRD